MKLMAINICTYQFILIQLALILSAGLTGMDMTANLMGNNGVKMELQRQEVNGHWDQHTIIPKIIVVYAAKLKLKVM